MNCFLEWYKKAMQKRKKETSKNKKQTETRKQQYIYSVFNKKNFNDSWHEKQKWNKENYTMQAESKSITQVKIT